MDPTELTQVRPVRADSHPRLGNSAGPTWQRGLNTHPVLGTPRALRSPAEAARQAGPGLISFTAGATDQLGALRPTFSDYRNK